jgi:hypothetical protein
MIMIIVYVTSVKAALLTSAISIRATSKDSPSLSFIGSSTYNLCFGFMHDMLAPLSAARWYRSYHIHPILLF